MVEQVVDGITVRLKHWHDLSFLSQLGQAFCVFDQLISGNICFGIADDGRKYFAKYAGAPTIMYAGQPETAVQQLKSALTKHLQLQHPALNQVLHSFDTAHGFVIVFPWFEGYALAPLAVHLERLVKLPLVDRLALFDSLMDCLVQAENKDYLIAGITDHRILIDFERIRPLLSSASHFRRFPTSVPHPKLPGASWYVPPEGYKVGADLDASANAFVLGSLAFTFFGNQTSRSLKSWSARPSLFEIAQIALQEKPEARMATAALFQSQWRDAVLRIPL